MFSVGDRVGFHPLGALSHLVGSTGVIVANPVVFGDERMVRVNNPPSWWETDEVIAHPLELVLLDDVEIFSSVG